MHVSNTAIICPLWKQSNLGKKDYIMMSFQNKTNDLQTDKFLKDWTIFMI